MADSLVFDIMAADRASSVIEKIGDKLGGLGKVMAGAGLAAGGAFAASLLGAMDIDASNDKLAAQLGLSSQQSAEAGKIAGDLYAQNYGDSIEGVNEALGAVYSSFPGLADQGSAALQDITADALAFASAFDTDVSEAVNTAGILLKQGLADDAESAFDLMTVASQKLPASLRGELPALLDEYGQFYDKLGFTGNEALSMIVRASDLGAIGMDKWGDSLKEFTIRATDNSSAVQAYQTLGLSSEDMSNKILAGGKTAQGALQEIVTGLKGIQDPTAQANAAISFFGTPLEDLGTQKIPQFLDALGGAPSVLGNVAGATADMSATLSGNASSNLESFKRQVSMAFVEMLGGKALPAVERATAWLSTNLGPVLVTIGHILTGTVIPAVQSTGEWFAKYKGWLIPVAAAVTAMVVAWKIYTTTMAVVQAVTKAYTAVQLALNIVMSMNPIGLVIIAIIGLVAAIVVAWNTSETFRDVVLGVWAAISGAVMTAIGSISGVVMGVWNWVSENWPLLLAIITGPIGLAAYMIIGHWDTIKSGFTSVKDWIGQKIDDIVSFITGIPGRISSAASGMWDGISGSFKSMLNSIIGWWNRIRFPTLHIPGFDTGIPGVPSFKGLDVGGWSMPQITPLAQGGIVSATPGGILANIGEGRHDEAVVPLDGRHGLGGEQIIVLRIEGDGLFDGLRKEIRIRGGRGANSVQVALGQGAA